ncbi:hypothetical protein NPX13_g8415 [Xylaria arbuscula]|uniref:ABC transporter domain-containing protein n=1 Tax=Xylaria arbuscula TaxID=114810 RepID=A0A9W8TK66_9PEZI|nr:hypothetical protein NPX13_g8415 [Xylaria arbuscula]
MEAESVTTILCTSKQTRFNIGVPNYRELDVEGLNITVTSASSSKGSKVSKGKARSEGTEILDNATLRLKAGQRYALVGRNGSGKSIPEETRIVILQQTDTGDINTKADVNQTVSQPTDRSVLEEVIERATARHEAQRELDGLTRGVESTRPFDALRSLRKIRRERLQKDLFLKAKDAKLRSGARGMQARKSLIAAEKTAAEFETIHEPRYAQKDDEISSDTLAKETSEAAELLADLQLQVEPSKMAAIESRAKKLLTGLGFSESAMSKPVSSLSGGWRMRTALASALLQETDILILDEPTNFLDLLGILWLEKFLTALDESGDPAPTLILVSHDRDFISLCTDLLILKAKGITYFHGDLPTYEEAQREKKIYLTKMKEAQDKQKDHIQQT